MVLLGKNGNCTVLPCWSRRRPRRTLVYLLALCCCPLIFLYIDTPRDFSKSPSGRFLEYESCQSRKNLVFLKVHKCASSSVGNVLLRRGLFIDGATFGLPKQDPAHIGWPHSILPHHILRPRNRSPNMILHHFIYNRTTLNSLMPSDTVYISMIREPYSQFQSSIHYFKEIKQLKLKDYDRVGQFLRAPHHYEKKVQMYINVHPPAYFSLTRNVMSIEFGLPEKDQENKTKIEKFVKNIDQDFHLVLIYEYFFESMILLRRLLCWRFKDILFRTVNFKFKYDNLGTKEDRELHSSWSMADHILYKALNDSFWSKIRLQKSDFQEEVSHLRSVIERLSRYCKSIDIKIKFNELRENEAWLKIAGSRFHDQFYMTPEDCSDMLLRPDHYYHQLLRSNYNWAQTLLIYVYHHWLKFT